MSVCVHSGVGVYDDGTLPTTTQFLAQCTCGALVMVENGRIADHVPGATAPWDAADGCFGHCDPEGWHRPCRDHNEQEQR